MSRWLVVLAFVLAPSIASAAPPSPQYAMETYFSGERTGGKILMGMGTAGLMTGGLLYFQDSPTMTGASYTFLGVGLLHIAAGIYIHVASNNRVEDFTKQIDADPAAFVAAESKRMRGVSTQFTVLKIVECVLIAGGITAAIYGHKTDRPRLKGVGIALAIEMGATLAFDFTAASRAHEYRDALATAEPRGGSSGPRTFMFVHTGAF